MNRRRAIQQGDDEYVCPKCSARAASLDRLVKHYRDWHEGKSDYSPYAHQYIGPYASEAMLGQLREGDMRTEGKGILARIFRSKFKRQEKVGVARLRAHGLSKREIAEGVYAQRLHDQDGEE